MDASEADKRMTSGRASIWGRPYFASLMRSRRNCLLIPMVFIVPGAFYLFGITIWQCPMHQAFGLPCPGCGMTRAFEAGLYGRIEQVLSYHPLSPLMMLLLVLLLLAAVLPERPRQTMIRVTERVEHACSPAVWLLIAFLALFISRLFGAFPIPG